MYQLYFHNYRTKETTFIEFFKTRAEAIRYARKHRGEQESIIMHGNEVVFTEMTA